MSQYRFALRLKNKYNVPSSQDFFAPIYASQDFLGGGGGTGPRHAMVWIHGLAANANSYFCDGVLASRPFGLDVLNVAPWFGDQGVSERQWSGNGSSSSSSAGGGSGARSAWWSGSGWIGGENNAMQEYATSFDVLDTIVDELAEAKASGVLPNLARITIAGFSAGAQLVNRWAVFSPMQPSSPSSGISVRAIVADGYVRTKPASAALLCAYVCVCVRVCECV